MAAAAEWARNGRPGRHPSQEDCLTGWCRERPPPDRDVFGVKRLEWVPVPRHVRSHATVKLMERALAEQQHEIRGPIAGLPVKVEVDEAAAGSLEPLVEAAQGIPRGPGNSQAVAFADRSEPAVGR